MESNIFNVSKNKLEVFSKPGFYDWIGDHRPHGILFMYGSKIKSGKKIDAKVIDIVPTALTLMNTSIPNNIDGKVVKDAFIKKPVVKKSKVKKQKRLSNREITKIKNLRKKN